MAEWSLLPLGLYFLSSSSRLCATARALLYGIFALIFNRGGTPLGFCVVGTLRRSSPKRKKLKIKIKIKKKNNFLFSIFLFKNYSILNMRE